MSGLEVPPGIPVVSGMRRRNMVARLAMIAGVAAASGYALAITAREAIADRIERLAMAFDRADEVPTANDALDRWLWMCGGGCPARALDAASAGKLRLAAVSAPRDRRPFLDQAERLSRRALSRAPISAESWARLALTHSEQDGGRASPAAVQALLHAYAAAPYSREASAWRILFCADHWDTVGPRLRGHAADELIWLNEVDRPTAQAVMSRVADPAARYALELRLDYAPAPRVAPRDLSH